MRCPYCSKEIEDGAIICGHCGSAVMEPAGPRLTEANAFDQEQVLFEYKHEKKHYTWQPACVELDPVARTLAIYGSPDGTPEITIPVSEIAHCEIIESEDIPRDMSRTSGGELSGVNDLGDLVLGLLIIVLFAVFEATIEKFRARRTKVPVLRLTQSKGDDSDQGWVLDLRSDKRGKKGRAATLEMAHRVVAILRLTGYGGIIPKELSLPKAREALMKEVRASQVLQPRPDPSESSKTAPPKVWLPDTASRQTTPMDTDTLIERYSSGERSFRDISLREADLRGVDLGGSDLRGSNLYGADLRQANLSRADLRQANLYGADLRKANLCEADLREASLYGAELGGARLGEANLAGADLTGAELRGADLGSTDLSGAFLQGTGVAQEQLAQAASIKGTTVQDGWALEPWREVATPILSLAATWLLPLFLALSASVFLVTLDQLFITESDAPGALSLIYLLGVLLVPAIAGAFYSYHSPGGTNTATAFGAAVLGAIAGLLHALVDLVRGEIMVALPGYGWTGGELEYLFFTCVAGNVAVGGIVGAIAGVLWLRILGSSETQQSTPARRWSLIGSLALYGVSLCIWVAIIAMTRQ